MIKGSIQEEDRTFINIYTSNIGAPKQIKQILAGKKGEIDSNTIILGTLMPLFHQGIDHPGRKSIRKHWP